MLHQSVVHQKTQGFFDEPRRSEEHTSELQSRPHLVCRLLLEKKKKRKLTAPFYSDHRLEYNHLLRDNHETPLYTLDLIESQLDLSLLPTSLKLRADHFTAHSP